MDAGLRASCARKWPKKLFFCVASAIGVTPTGMNKLSVLALALALSGSACVKKSDYEALKAKDAAHQKSLEESLASEREHAAALDQALRSEQAKSASQAEEIARLGSDLEASQKKISEMVGDSSKLKASIQEMQAALSALNEQKRQTDARIAEYRKLLASFQALIDAGKLKVKVVNGRMIVELPSDVLFASGSIDLSDAGKASISEIGTILAPMSDRKFQVEGHTDDQPIKTARFPSNWWLASGRAIAVAEILIKAALPPTSVSAASFGEFQPITSNSTPPGRAQNRRIEIVLVPDLSKVPGFEDLDRVAKQ
ncbi:MAG: Flagellar motor rotation protein MotB [Myxococcaceae bacterium]|nr:Flagellar motor rotation protein MotB [Myxococcaceae bacterium]